ncbi:ComEC family competence protein [Serratia quinivorans]|uniref:ComEC/Rec2 family competence protein n=1 Tax=Serratia quinivorans TaxID=137545 RepID=UPI000D9E98A4|nr:MBL fold metallo-hydrolase [Serratia quinivorans]SPZ60307.1 ComEC family competence protein [Serratia quinivorans]VEI68404.1 ComEC family competence protein [Serratia quinivorans]
MTVTVFNVKQGDSFLIHSEMCFSNVIPLLVDTGCKTANIKMKLPSSLTELAVLITHSHRDHMGGLTDLLTDTHLNVAEVFIPWYLPEILQINKILKKEFAAYKKLSVPHLKNVKLSFLGEGDTVFNTGCDNFKVINPPKDAETLFAWFTNETQTDQNNNVEVIVSRLNDLGFDINIRDITNYTPEFTPEGMREAYREQSRKFVMNFFTSMSSFIFGATEKSITSMVRTHLKLLSNHTSIVFNYKCVTEDKSWLFTGDADINAFERIISGGYDKYLKADVLKVPHHGSTNNLTSSILSYIDPTYAVISHDNYKSNHKDPHPSLAVLSMLKKNKVKVFYTNDVKKPKLGFKTLISIHRAPFNAIFNFV